MWQSCRVSDPHWSNADPDTDPDPAFFLIALMIQNWKKFTTRNLIFIFLIKNCNLLIPRPSWSTPKLQEKPSALKREHPALQKMKILSFFLFFWDIFLPSWIRIRIQQLKLKRIHADPDTDPDSKPCNPDPTGTYPGSRVSYRYLSIQLVISNGTPEFRHHKVGDGACRLLKNNEIPLSIV